MREYLFGTLAAQDRTHSNLERVRSERVFIGTNGREVNIERVRHASRPGTGHDVPVPEITRRWSAAQKKLAETAASLGAIDVLDNSHGTTRHIVSITKGIRLPATPTPAWARTMLRPIEQHSPAK